MSSPLHRSLQRGVQYRCHFHKSTAHDFKESFALHRSPDVGMPFMPWLCFHRRESLQNAAGVHGLLALATLT